ncbi:hypothetical protein MGLY_15090 [Neomoorella glycerini]|uniref:Uncharacterized protein n=1 Tax=Neomoorella glycerini TaxID=55779 RepID=A0A6I5ZRE9_9FIRM|nr:vitamin B12 dependent-methionine synthase activation domain-containing protein [Moorella glycerini]QGP92147.1 hypothetical protein MGLY_15050 [Moorella glycerini]QGP92151.1 hypothetical protein MGLY_15090 [Moorella glycerini]
MRTAGWRTGETRLIKDLEVTVDVEKLLAMQGMESGRSLETHIKELYDSLCREARSLAEPAFAWAYYEPVTIINNELRLPGGQVIKSRFLAKKLAPARGLLVMAATIGPRLEARIKEYQAAGDTLASYLLDLAGSALVEAAYYSGFQQVEMAIAAAGLEATTPFGPGHSYWDNLADQELIFSLVDAGSLGITLTASYLMLPRKSVSGISGIGQGFEVGEYHCHYCNLRRTCPLSRAKGGEVAMRR